jgi:hypothetical protein
MSADRAPETATAEAPTPPPAGSGVLDGAATSTPVDPHPEAKVGQAFAGGLAVALVLRRLSKRRHRA